MEMPNSHGRVGAPETSIDADVYNRTVTALRDRERELSQLVDMVPSHLWRLSANGEPTFFNKRMVDFLGLDVSDTEKPGMTRRAAMIEAAVHPDEAAAFAAALEHAIDSGEPFAMRYRLRRADGVYRWMSSRAEPMRNDDGQIVQWYGLCHDIEDQIRGEETLRRSEQQLRETIDAVPIRIWSTASTGGPVYFNKRYRDHLQSVVADPDGIAEARIDQLMQELVHPEDILGVWRSFQTSAETGHGTVMRFRWREQDGVYRWAECRVEPRRDQSGQILQWYGVSLDIDDEVRAQEALRERERQLRQLIDAVPAMIWSTTREGTPSYVNKRFTDATGASLADLTAPDGSPSLGVVHPDDRPMAKQAIAYSFDTGAPYVARYRQIRRDGSYRWTETRAEPLRDEAGAILQWYGVSVDIDEMVAAQESLHEREQELSLLVDMVPSHLWRVTPDGQTTLVNKHMADFMGMDPGDTRHADSLLGTLFHPDEVDAVWEHFTHCLQSGEPFAMKYRLRRTDGVYRWMSGRAEPMRDERGQIVQWFGLCHDIDDQVHAEEALRRASDRLNKATQAASLAELSASIAHEVNQPLAAIVANSHACQRWLTADPPNVGRAKITADRIIRDANSASAVVGRIRALFQRTPHARSPESVNRLIGEVCRLMADETLARGVRIKTDLEQDLPQVALDRVQVQQVLVNLIRNGIEAMDSVVDGAQSLLIRSRLEVDGAIRVEVCDAGTGFEDQERVFEPFFTTKQNGMGMGLAICRSIIESHGGRLWAVNNKPPIAATGATVAFTLPLAASETA